MATYNPNNPTAGGTTSTGSTTYGTETTRQGSIGSTSGMGGSGSTGVTGSESLRGGGMSQGTTGAGIGGGMQGGMQGMQQEGTAGGAGVTRSLGERLERAGDFLEQKGKAAFLSERLHNAGKYLQDTEPRQILRTVDEAICAHPYRGMLIGLGIGWVVGRFLSGRGE